MRKLSCPFGTRLGVSCMSLCSLGVAVLCTVRAVKYHLIEESYDSSTSFGTLSPFLTAGSRAMGYFLAALALWIIGGVLLWLVCPSWHINRAQLVSMLFSVMLLTLSVISFGFAAVFFSGAGKDTYQVAMLGDSTRAVGSHFALVGVLLLAAGTWYAIKSFRKKSNHEKA